MINFTYYLGCTDKIYTLHVRAPFIWNVNRVKSFTDRTKVNRITTTKTNGKSYYTIWQCTQLKSTHSVGVEQELVMLHNRLNNAYWNDEEYCLRTVARLWLRIFVWKRIPHPHIRSLHEEWKTEWEGKKGKKERKMNMRSCEMYG